ncbi:hypothetical protein FACS189440_22140 [Bacteroidia bacterium]|nr:hypothetical protein FACS189423_05860 [Bacteroidia bacterium]GHT52618.1 hypothetical protein FACS189440_22140 [Bacteroidia bacterium]
MDTVSVNILNPKAFVLLKDLEKLNLISIETGKRVQKKEKSLINVIRSFRDEITEEPLSMEEITAEVELARAERYAANK